MYLRTWAKTIDKMELLCFNKFTINSIFFYNILSENRKYKNSAVLLNATASTNCFVSRTLGGKSTLVILELGYVKCFYWSQGLGDDLLCGKPLLHLLDCVEAPCTSVSMAKLSCTCWLSWTWVRQFPHIIFPDPEQLEKEPRPPSNRFWKINHIFTSLYLTSDIFHHQELWI